MEDNPKIRLCALLHDIGKIYIYDKRGEYMKEFESGNIGNKGKYHVIKTRDFLVGVSKRAKLRRFSEIFEFAVRNAPKHHKNEMLYGEFAVLPGDIMPSMVADADTYASIGDRTYEVRVKEKVTKEQLEKGVEV
ncbi:MAG: HD domain-containing protein, partial [Nanoarchaeota archaeon]|nr:HD domain-containing protein [Nanoarchaeota archaeon]